MTLPDPRPVLPTSLELRRETVEGFVSRSGRFVAQSGGSFVAERWVSAVFNVRPRSEEASSEVAASPVPRNDDEDGRLRLRLETLTGFYPNRGGGFSPRPDGSWLGNRWVSEFRNVRLQSDDGATPSSAAAPELT